MDDRPTCGKGLAEHSAMPAALGALMAALAENLELHQGTLELTDPSSRAELAAYVELAKEQREIARQLLATASRMAGYKDLPMGQHDERALANPKLLAAFETFVKREEELLELLLTAHERDAEMLSAARGQAGTG
jgi:hypothetical protein